MSDRNLDCVVIYMACGRAVNLGLWSWEPIMTALTATEPSVFVLLIGPHGDRTLLRVSDIEGAFLLTEDSIEDDWEYDRARKERRKKIDPEWSEDD